MLIGATPNIVRAGQRACERLLIVDRQPPDLSSLLRGERDQFYLLDYTDPSQLDDFAVTLGRTGPQPSAVVSVTEEGLEPAAHLVDRFGLPGLSYEVVATTRDKQLMRRILSARAPELSLPHAPASDRSAVEQVIAFNGTAVLKPTMGTASRGVHLLRSISDYDLLAESDVSNGTVEAFAHGIEVSVESMSLAGQHRVILIAEKLIGDGFVEVAHLTPPPSLSAVDIRRVEAATVRLLDALGIIHGPAHTELMVSADRVTVIETHNRPGGDGIADLVAATAGVDWRQASVAWVTNFDTSVDEIISVCATEPVSTSAAMVFFTAPPGMVTKIQRRPEQVVGANVVSWHVDVEVGDEVGPLHSSADRLGAARLLAPDSKTLQDAVKELIASPVVQVKDRSVS